MSLGLMIDKKTKRFVDSIFFCRIHERVLNPLISALSLRLFGKDITTVGQQKAKSESENREHQTETPVEHAPMIEEDEEFKSVLEDGLMPAEAEGNAET